MKFSVGDEVVVIKEWDRYKPTGVGVVRGITTAITLNKYEDNIMYAVEFSTVSVRLHSCFNLIKNDRGYFLPSSVLESVYKETAYDPTQSGDDDDCV